MGGNHYVHFLTFPGSLRIDVPVRFFQEKQFRSSVLCLLPLPDQHGKIASTSSMPGVIFFFFFISLFILTLYYLSSLVMLDGFCLHAVDLHQQGIIRHNNGFLHIYNRIYDSGKIPS